MIQLTNVDSFLNSVQFLIYRTKIKFWDDKIFQKATFPQLFEPETLYTYHAKFKQQLNWWTDDSSIASDQGLFSLSLGQDYQLVDT